MPLRVLAFESFDGGSHRAVRASIRRHAHLEWTWCTRPGRAWKWRMRTGAAELVAEASEAGVLDAPFDAIFVTSLCAVTDLVALLPRRLRQCPIVLYMHENQLEYPAQHAARERDVHFAVTNLTSVLAADRVLWNSAWNRDSFLQGVPELLGHAPDGALRDAPERIAARSTVAWPPVEPPPESVVPDRVLHNPPRVLWPHRWEHDKGPELLLESAASVPARWTLLGERFRAVPDALHAFRDRFGGLIDHDGYAETPEDYWRLVAASDWVHSTARHEFFGVAVVEALLAGCLPWLPMRLSYPEILPACAHGLDPRQPPDDVVAVRKAILDHLAPAVAPNAVRRIESEVERACR